ncbi:MAG: fatty acid hydroxylase [Gammaproteobacteria bacterium]|nr:fatty acid hydroxylase [Gammaproteobacteria bacterium]NIR83225.1 fatty acid hydroxylase [Gammaproteobacteria bacterium]NIR91033.1 fatty acid hydroxylase [Gammaproteobacteria bacterium]NIU04390.1 fatty acid hydroxylase [Gammaproteobacteria bacterium]NIV52613.1 fatty acid hydroxylase [Gammaproteobacteria bacterium]
MMSVVSTRDESVRMFRSNLLEALSHVHPAAPHLIYVPVIALALFAGYDWNVGSGTAIVLFLGGLLAWTFIEYLIHRFVFHVPAEIDHRAAEVVRNLPAQEPVMPRLGLREKVYFMMHGVHHFFPNDSRRLVMPPGVSVPLAAGFWVLYTLLLGMAFGTVFFAGSIAGYLAYDTTHFLVHHRRCRGRWSGFLKKVHMRHHFLDPEHYYGVSSPLWDFVLGTWRTPQTAGARGQTG